MKKLNQAIDRFCALHPDFGIPGLMRYIVGSNILFYIFYLIDNRILEFLYLDPAKVFQGEVWRLFSYALMPESGGFTLLLSCLFYYWVGNALERIWGSAKFIIYYVSGVLLTTLGVLIVYLVDGISVSIYGAGYVSSALFFAYAIYNSEATIYFMFIIPLKMKWLAWIEAGLYVFSMVSALADGFLGLAVLPVIALLNLFVFFSPVFSRRVRTETARHRPEAIHFRKAVREQQKQRGYNHKCTVCGKTDTEYPDLQFRYCSKCSGYHCYCEEHIFNHTHFTE